MTTRHSLLCLLSALVCGALGFLLAREVGRA